MGLPKKERYFFICNKNNQTISVENGAITVDARPTPLHESPDGWKDIQVAFGTNNKYWSLNRSFTIPLKFVGEGADILRYFIYNGKGYEEELYVMILRYNSLFVDDDGKEGQYELEYKGKIDFTKMKDDPTTGVTINTIEGSLLSYLNANDGISYEIACNKTNLDCVKVKFDGTELFDRYKFSFLDVDLQNPGQAVIAVPFAFISREGDSVGIITGSPTYELITTDLPTYVSNSANYFFSSATSTNVNIDGQIKFSQASNQFGSQTVILLRSSLGTSITLFNEVISDPAVKTIDLHRTLPLAADEKYFIIAVYSGELHFLETNLFVSTITINPPSVAYALQPLQLGKQLVSKMTDGRYTMESKFLTIHNNIVATGGESIRGIEDAVLKTSFQDYFNSYNSLWNLGGKVIDNVLWLEPKGDLYNDSSDIFDLGEVSDFSVGYAEEYLVNSVKVGYPVQDYGERNGRFEFNDTIEEKLPVTAVNKELTLISKYRGDSYGIEFNRGKLNNQDTTDNKGDNEVFLVNIDTSVATDGTILLSVAKNPQDFASGSIAFDVIVVQSGGVEDFITMDATKSSFKYTNENAQNARITFYAYGTKTADNEPSFVLTRNGQPLTSQLVQSFQTTFRISLTVEGALNPSDVIQVAITSPVSLTSAGMDILITEVNATSVYNLKRGPYTLADGTLSGVPTDTVYNIEEMTPKRMLLTHGNYLRSLLYQLPTDTITFQTADKNKDLVTITDGVTIAEKADVIVGTLPDPLFLPFELTFTTKVPFSFNKIMTKLNAGHIKFTYNNFPLYCLPIGDMKCKPVTDEAQEWKLLASPLNSLDTLLKLSQGATIIQDYMNNQIIISDLNPVHWVKYDYKTPAKYHFKGIYDDRFEGRISSYDSKAKYYQKWQTNDFVNLQFVTVGYGALQLSIYDGEMNQVNLIAATITPDTSLQTPYIKQEFNIDLSVYPVGFYQFVVLINGVNLMISEWQQLDADLPNTILIEYYNTKNKPDAYFATWRPALRVEGFFTPVTPESTSTTYEDEPGDTEILSGTAYMKQKVLLGGGSGIPDYLAKKLNRLFLLNRVYLDGVEYTKVGDAKLETVELATGYPMNYYTVDLRESLNSQGLVVSDVDLHNSFTSTLTLDAEAFGGAPGVIQIEID